MMQHRYTPPKIDSKTYKQMSRYKTLYEAMKRELDAAIRAHDEAIRTTDEHEKPRTLNGLVYSRNTLVEFRNVMQHKEEEAGIKGGLNGTLLDETVD